MISFCPTNGFVAQFHQRVITSFLFFVIGRGDANRWSVTMSVERRLEMTPVISRPRSMQLR
jgi:hypothetical protein